MSTLSTQVIIDDSYFFGGFGLGCAGRGKVLDGEGIDPSYIRFSGEGRGGTGAGFLSLIADPPY